jgi:tripartite-type tricarboxylate transporter receptor subunit TctC
MRIITVLVILCLFAGSLYARGEQESVGGGEGNPTDEVVWPTDTVTILVGVRAGGNQDLKARILAKYLSEEIDMPVVVENVPGASGSLAAVNYLEEKPNTNKLFFVPLALLSLNPLYQEVIYSIDDFLPVASFDTSDFGLFVKADGRFEDFDDLIEYGKDKLIKFGSAGPGAANYLYSQATFNLSGARADTITHGNANEGLSNVLAGTTDVNLAALNATAIDYINEGQLIPILTYADEPVIVGGLEIPTAQSYGLDLSYAAYTYLATRTGTNPEVVDFITKSIYNVYANPDFQEEAERLNIQTIKDTQQEILDYLVRSIVQAKELHELVTGN